ncbi:8032_t:CDS:2, partial [Racocetra persica]
VLHNIMRTHEYFNRRHSKWSIIGFLNESDEESFQLKIGVYLKNLENIINHEQGARRDKAQLLYDNYKKASKSFFIGNGTQPDYKMARQWEMTHKPGLSVRLNHPKVTISGNSIVDSIVGAFNARIDSTKRSQEHQKETKRNQKRSKVTIADDNVDEIETLDNHNNKIETTDNHADGIEIVDDHEDMLEDDESLEFDFDSVVKSLQQEPINEWKVHGINVTRKFREYQQEVLETLKTTGLTWYNTYETLALSSIIVLGRNCPYPNFTEEEWQSITQTNKYTIHEPVIPSSVSTALHETVIKHLLGRDSYMHADETPLSRAVARTFNELRENLPDLASQRTSEDEHCRIFLNPYISSIFLKKNNNYEVQLNRAVKGTKQRPDLSCVVDNVPLLNSEIKPMGSRPLNKKKDFSKVHLRGRKTINQQLTSKGGPGETAMLLNHGDIVQTYFMDLQFDGLYRSWPFLTTKLAIDEPSLPLIESNFAHFVALERRVCELAKDYKRRRGPFTPPLQIRYMRSVPDSPQIRNML